MKTHYKHALAFFTLLICASANAQTLDEAIRLTDSEQFEKAKVVFRQLIKTDPNNGDNYFYFGNLMLKTEDVDSSKVLFQKGLDINPTNPLTHVGVARYMFAAGNAAGAEKEIVNAKALVQTQGGKTIDGPRQIKILLAIAETEIMAPMPNFDDAVKLTNDAELLDKKSTIKNADIFIIRGDVLFKKDQVNATAAITSYLTAARLDPKSCKANLRIGSIYANGKNMQSAIGYYNVALKSDSTFAPAWRMKGEALYQIQKFDSASYCYNKYLKLNDDPWARYRICLNTYKSGSFDDAITEGNKALSQDGSIIIIYRILGRCYMDKKVAEPVKSIEAFNTFFEKQKVVGKPPIIPEDYIYRAKAYSKNNQDSLAIIDYNTAMKIDTARHDIYFDLATEYYKIKKYDMAAMYYKKKIDLNPANATISDWTAYGRSLMIQKNYAGADSAFTKVTIMDPKNPVGWFYRGKANAFMDPEFKTDSARSFYEHYFDLAMLDKEKNKKELIVAGKYLAGYQFVKKNYACSKAYFQFVLELDPANTEVKNQLDTDKDLKAATAAEIGTCKVAPGK